MDFIRRLGIFSVGLSIGIVILFFFFRAKNVEFCYFPNCRVLKDIRSKSVRLSPEAQAHFSLEEIKPIFWHGTVDFSQSQTRTSPCKTYCITGETQSQKKVKITVENCPKRATVLKIEPLSPTE